MTLNDWLKNASQDVRDQNDDLAQDETLAGSHLELNFLSLLKIANLPNPEREFKFSPSRKWRFDFAYPDLKIAIEIEGGVWARGRHTRPQGFIDDCEKYNAAVLLGWRVLRAVPEQFNQVIEILGQLLDSA